MTSATPPATPSPTFRDPAGSLRLEPNTAVRSIHPSARAHTLDFLHSPFYRRLVDRGDIVASAIHDAPTGLTLHHPLIPIPTYPWEWTPSQWLAAADLTLSLCDEALAEGWILKDATPLNILFLGPRPILVDVLSFDPWDPSQPHTQQHPPPQIWLAYGQYMRTFLLPLLMNRLLGWPLALSLFKRDGYEPADLYHALSWPQRLSRAAFWPITLPSILEKKAAPTPKSSPPKTPAPKDPDLVLHVLRRTLAALRRMTHRAMPRHASSDWSDYTSTLTHYTSADSAQKLAWVRQILADTTPAHVLDIGANTGEFSALAASTGASVTALERDPAAADRLFRLSQTLPSTAGSILTIHADLARPTPATGWLNRETLPLLDRLESHFDLVLLLAVIHHLLLMEQIPLPAILALCHRLTRRHLVLEWVPPTDPMFLSLMRGRDDLYAHLSESDLLSACSNLFHPLQRQPLANNRILYLFEKL